jgi:hypothetical protein
MLLSLKRAEDGPLTQNGRPAAGVLCSVGIMAYNEEENIADAIGTILGQDLHSSHVAELIVVASGCEDQTVPIVSEIAGRDARVRLIEQPEREGKASAINLFLAAATSAVLLMVSADVLVEDGTIDALLRHFDDPTVGMVGGHPIPVNGEATFLGHAVHLQWRMHDRIARETPKLGEIVAFRNVVPSIPTDTAVDEISIQALVEQLGYRLVYEPQAIVYNRGPTTARDFLRQRRRIYAGHLRVADQQGYAAPTMSSSRLVRALLGSGAFLSPRGFVWTIGAVGLEATARGLGHYDVVRHRPQHVWDMCATTKQHVADGANGHGEQNVLVFHVVDFNRHQLELGFQTTRHLMQRVRDHIKRTVGSTAIVSIRRSGTIVALVDGDRDAAERIAAEIVDHFDATPLPLNGHGPTQVTLACGVIAFPDSGPCIAQSIPLPVPVVEPATAVAG